jgi:hypothetical protein
VNTITGCEHPVQFVYSDEDTGTKFCLLCSREAGEAAVDQLRKQLSYTAKEKDDEISALRSMIFNINTENQQLGTVVAEYQNMARNSPTYIELKTENERLMAALAQLADDRKYLIYKNGSVLWINGGTPAEFARHVREKYS